MTKLYVVVPSYGYEGLGEPVAVFLNQEEADTYAAHLEKANSSYCVYEAPLMRFVPAKVEPVELP